MSFLQKLLVLFMVSSPAVLWAADDPKCALKRVASLDLVGDPDLYMIVAVTIQGTPGILMRINTGYAFSTISDAVAARLSLHTRELPQELKVTAGKTIIEKEATASELTLENIHFKNADFLVVPDGSTGSSAGVLGMNTFTHFDIEIDMAARKLNLYSQDHCPGKVVYWADAYDAVPIRFGKLGEFYFPMELDGKKIETTLATGNDATLLSTDVTRKLFNFDETSPGVELETGAGGTMAHYRAMKLSAEGLSVINANIRLVKNSNPACGLSSRNGAVGYEDNCMGTHPLLLGLNVLKRLHVYIATKEKVLYFTSANIANQR